MKVKIVFGDDMRRWRYPESNRFMSLRQFVKDTFKFSDDTSFYVQFADDEGDRVTITSERDFNDAFACAEQEKRKSLKIFVYQGSDDDKTHLKNGEASMGASSAQTDAESDNVNASKSKGDGWANLYVINFCVDYMYPFLNILAHSQNRSVEC